MGRFQRKSFGFKIVKILNSFIDNFMLCIFLIMLAVGGYALWDSHNINAAAQPSVFEVYKPTETDDRSFTDFQAVNTDVFGWINVYGTNIDYPLVQSDDNEKYLNTAADGTFSLSGSIFLDYRNSKNFDDFNSIIYGHHMANKVMFGPIEDFVDKDYFDEHQYGSIYFNGQTHGLEFFAFLEVDAYDSEIFSCAIQGESNQQNYLDLIMSRATHLRDLNVDTSDQIILLSTCTSDSTNGRHILVAKLSETVHEDTFTESQSSGVKKVFESIFVWQWVLLDIVILIFVIVIINKKKKMKEG